MYKKLYINNKFKNKAEMNISIVCYILFIWLQNIWLYCLYYLFYSHSVRNSKNLANTLKKYGAWPLSCINYIHFIFTTTWLIVVILLPEFALTFYHNNFYTSTDIIIYLKYYKALSYGYNFYYSSNSIINQ